MPPRARIAVLAAFLTLGAPAGFGQLALHLTFDQAGNLAADSSGNGHVASPTGSVTFTASGVSGGAGVFSDGAYYTWTGGPAATFTGSFTTAI